MPRITFDLSEVNPLDPDRVRHQRYMERVAHKAAEARQHRRKALLGEQDGVHAAVTALLTLSEEAGNPDIRLRRRFVRLDEARERESDPARLPQRADEQPGVLSKAVARDVATRPPATQLVHRPSRALALYLTGVFEAHCTTPAGTVHDNSRRLTAAPDGWAVLVGDKLSTPRNRRVHLARALDELCRKSLVQLPPSRSSQRYDRFQLLMDDGRGEQRYQVPGSTGGVMDVPPAFFLNGWHLVLEPREIATWLMLYEMSRYHRGRGRAKEGVGIVEAQRWGFYGVTSEVYAAHRELSEFGLVTTHDSVAGRRMGRVDPATLDEPQDLVTYQFSLNPRAFEREAFAVVVDCLSNPLPPYLES
jgi:hypothetical protein